MKKARPKKQGVGGSYAARTAVVLPDAFHAINRETGV